MWYVAPSFRNKEFLCDPYERDGKFYVKIMGAKAPREIRVYEEWQNSWPSTDKPRVERTPEGFFALNYPDGRYGYIVGIRSDGEREGFWRYRKLPDKNYSWHDNIVLSPLFGYTGSIERMPIEELDPEFISVDSVRLENGFRRLVSEEWYLNELDRLRQLWGFEEK